MNGSFLIFNVHILLICYIWTTGCSSPWLHLLINILKFVLFSLQILVSSIWSKNNWLSTVAICILYPNLQLTRQKFSNTSNCLSHHVNFNLYGLILVIHMRWEALRSMNAPNRSDACADVLLGNNIWNLKRLGDRWNKTCS